MQQQFGRSRFAASVLQLRHYLKCGGHSAVCIATSMGEMPDWLLVWVQHCGLHCER